MAAHYFNTVENVVTGKPVVGATVSVTDSGGTALALYSNEALTAQVDNPLTTDSTGWFEFYCAEDECEIVVSYGGAVQRTISNVNLLGGAVSSDLTALTVRVDDLEAADVTLSDRIEVLETAAEQNGTALVSGGIVVWESGLTFRISAATYYIGSTLYTSAEQTVTLSAADGSNPRIDVLYLNTSGIFGAVTGTAAASPSEPDIDPSTQLKRTFVLVGAAVSAPAGVSDENIYLENTEWTGTSSGSGWTLNSATSPYAGTVNIVAAAVAANGYISYDHGAAITLTSYDVLSLFVKPTVAFPSGRVLRVQWYNNGVALGTPVTIASGYWGFNASTLAYQFVAIPMANFVLPGGTTGDQLRITVVGGALSFQIDNIKLQVQGASVPQSSPGAITQADGDARYLKLTGGTLSGDLSVPDEAYDATAWNGSLEVPTKNAVRDKIQSMGVESIIIACSDETTALTTGTAKVTFRMPYAFTLSAVRASVTTAPTGGTLLTIDINESGTTILSTKLTFDASEKTTTTAATPAVISDSSLADDAEITIDIDAVGSTIAGAGLKVYLIGTRT